MPSHSYEKLTCKLCGEPLVSHRRCRQCGKVLETKRTWKTLCRCGKYHNAPSERDSRYCRTCKGEEEATGQPTGEPPIVEDGKEINEQSDL